MNEKLKELAEQAGYYLYDLTQEHGIKTVESALRDEWVTLEKFYELVDAAAVAREREACAKECESIGQHNFITLCAAAIRERTE